MQLWILCSLLAGAWLAFAIPLKPQVPSFNTLEIIATGQKNPAAKGSEVWVNGIQSVDGLSISASGLSLDRGWEIHDGIPLSYQNQPAILKWQGLVSGNLTLTFTSHPWSGKVIIRWDGNEQEVDLYSETGKDKTVSLPTRAMPKYLLYPADILTLSWLLFVASVWLATRPIKLSETAKVPPTIVVGYALPVVVVYCIYLLASWPGMMSPDTFNQWNQINTWNFKNWHPVFHTLNILLLTRIWNSPAIVALAQIMATSLIIGWGLAEFKRNGAADWAIWLTVAFFCLIPLYPQMSITLWKDVPYSLAIFSLSIIALKIIISDGRWLYGKFAWGALGVVSALITLYRHNGLPIALGFLIIAGICFRSYWKKIGLSLLLYVLLWQAITGPVYDYLKVPKGGTQDALASIAFFGIGAHIINDPAILSTNQYHYLQEILSMEGWKLYDCHTSTPMSYTPLLIKRNVYLYNDNLLKSFIELTIKKPAITLNHFLCITSYIWKITGDKDEYYNGTVVASETMRQWEENLITTNRFNPQYFSVTLHQTPIPKVRDFIQQMSVWLYTATSRILWRPALYLYIMLFSIIIYMIRSRSFSMSLVAAPSLIQTGVMLAVSVNSELRYQYAIIIIGLWIFLPLLTSKVKQTTPTDRERI